MKLVFPSPSKEIDHLVALAKKIRQNAQTMYVAGDVEFALRTVTYAEGIERACVEIAALNSISSFDHPALAGLADSQRDDPLLKQTYEPR